eukprot:m.453034 g.453034  ORF g.453034 m.453034 type:complete len:364 (+) comp21545_c0_seq1:65-1156(+)
MQDNETLSPQRIHSTFPFHTLQQNTVHRGCLCHSAQMILLMVTTGKETRYYSEVMDGGGLCDLTGKPRTAEIRFVCDPELMHAFEALSETSTCNYLVVVHTSYLCDHASFRTENRVSKDVVCIATDEGRGESPAPKRLSALEKVLHEEQVERARAAAVAKQTLQQQLNEAHEGGDGQNTGTRTLQFGGQKQQQQQQQQHPQQQQRQQDAMVQDTAANRAAAKQLLTHFLQGKQCFAGGHGWWLHEFCYQKHVKQVHQNGDGTKIEILLGAWDRDYHIRKITAMGGHKSKTSLVHYYSDGDYCDEISGPRQTKVKMMCSKSLAGSQVAISLHETSTCKYTMKLQSALFCDIITTADENAFPKLE